MEVDVRYLLLSIGLGLFLGGCLKSLPDRDEPDDDAADDDATSGDDDDATAGDDDDATPGDDDDATPGDDDDTTPGDDDDATPGGPCDGEPPWNPGDDEACTDEGATPLCNGCQQQDVTPTGCCHDGAVYFCDGVNHVVCTIDCTTYPHCGWVPNYDYYDCDTDGDPAPWNDPPMECP
jgi:hypothetical protein